MATTATAPAGTKPCPRCDFPLYPDDDPELDCPMCHDWPQHTTRGGPESGVERASAADGPPDDAETQEGAAGGTGCCALYRLLAAWVLREANTPDSA